MVADGYDMPLCLQRIEQRTAHANPLVEGATIQTDGTNREPPGLASKTFTAKAAAGAAEEVVPRGAQNWRAGEQEGLTRQFGVGISLRVKS